MKAKLAATLILAYSILLFLASVGGAVRDGGFSIFTVPVSGLLFVGPAIGIYRRVNWCRIFLGAWFALIFIFAVSFSFDSEFQFRPIYLVFLLGCALPVYLLFLYPPLKEYTRPAPQPLGIPPTIHG